MLFLGLNMVLVPQIKNEFNACALALSFNHKSPSIEYNYFISQQIYHR